jgi:hypothetical protein
MPYQRHPAYVVGQGVATGLEGLHARFKDGSQTTTALSTSPESDESKKKIESQGSHWRIPVHTSQKRKTYLGCRAFAIGKRGCQRWFIVKRKMNLKFEIGGWFRGRATKDQAYDVAQ